ncbi:MAG: AAA family ATPase [Fluviicola sp.]|nr:AAA family ATPase [Fluviicola sp.]
MERVHLKEVTTRFDLEKRGHLQVMYGPRQVGKTTIVNQFIEQTKHPVHFVTADAVGNTNPLWIEQQWSIVRELLTESATGEAVLVIDEIQKLDNWSEWVKREWDHDTQKKIPLKVLILGSSRLMLQQGLTESLAGRFETMYVGHWSYGEMKEAFGLTPEQYVYFGAYPGTMTLIQNEDRWKKYIRDSFIETSVSKDILMLTRVDKPMLLKRLFELGAMYSGQLLSYTKMLGQLQDAGNTTTLAHYLELLDTAGLLSGLEKYSKELFRSRASSPKFQVYNNALMSAISEGTFEEVKSDPRIWGRWVESAVGAHLKTTAILHDIELLYWKHRNDEVDFILKGRGKVVAIEVKSGAKYRVNGLTAFKKQHNPDKVYLIGGDGIPWQEFLLMDPIELLK